GAVRFAQKQIGPAGPGHHRRQFGQGQRAAQIHQSADEPQQQNEPQIPVGRLGHGLGNKENPRADDRPDDDRQRSAQAQDRRQSRRQWGRGLVIGRDVRRHGGSAYRGPSVTASHPRRTRVWPSSGYLG